MKTLFAIAVLSFAALVWAALAIVRHVRKNSARAAAQPRADAEISDAIELRLSALARQPSRQQAAAAAEATQDFTYFKRDGVVVHSDKKTFGEPPPPINPATADRP